MKVKVFRNSVEMGYYMTVVSAVLHALAINDQSADLLFRQAHTANAFTDEEVTVPELVAIYDLMKMAPTAMNSQPLRITWVSSPQARATLVEHMNEGNKAKTLAAPMTAILSADNNWHRHLPLTAPHAVAQEPFFEAKPEIRESMAQTSAWIQVGYFILAARAVGLDAGPMTGFDADGVDQALHSETGNKVLAVVNLGHASAQGTRPRAGRLAYEHAAVMV